MVVVVILIALSLATGLMVGYGVIGDGNPTDVFHKSTWTHIIDLVIKN
ncbi:DNA-directed RNA polymerase subunit beta [Bacillus sp. N9]